MNPARDGIIGVAIGDMLGVPVEHVQRAELEENPVVGIREHGSHDQPRGAWSDDTSLTLALASALLDGYQLEAIAKEFLEWKIHHKWTAHDIVFDVGRQTHNSLNVLYRILESGDLESLKYLHYETVEKENGNGSLMRILPLYFHIRERGIETSYEMIREVSALTHGHIRSTLACLMYLITIDELLQQDSIRDAYKATQIRMRRFFEHEDIPEAEKAVFARLVDRDISLLDASDISSHGYVIDTLESSFWSLLRTDSYKDAVLTAINLGGDTDTTGAVTGGLAGIFYGIESVPREWYQAVAKIEEIETLSDELHRRYQIVNNN